MTTSDRREVQLSGDDLDRARTAAGDALARMQDLGRLVVTAMEGSPDRAEDIERATVSTGETHGVHVFIYHGPEYCYVYVGDAGVCRPCTPEEEIQRD
jgi:hypothetical protein